MDMSSMMYSVLVLSLMLCRCCLGLTCVSSSVSVSLSVECEPGQACLTLLPHFKQGTDPVKGCFPTNGSIPGLVEGAAPTPDSSLPPPPLVISPVCEFRPQEDSAIKYCLCTTDLCNSEDYHEETITRTPKNFMFPFDDQRSETGQLEREGRQQGGLTCFSCGSLFNREAPACDQFDPGNPQQTQRCSPGEVCMLYTWNKSRTQIGSYRECFSTSILLGHPDYPLTPKDQCTPERTQKDERSSIRACLCTSDFCNTLPEDLISCPDLVVTNADFADCNGEYSLVLGESVEWAPDRPVYKHSHRDRYIFWNAGGLGWSIGKREYLNSGSHWHRSGLNTREPWEGEWEGGATVICAHTSQDTVDSVGDGEDCVWSDYSSWSLCTASCGRGTQTRYRRILKQMTGQGKPCRGLDRETRPCQAPPCTGAVCEWTEWGKCSESCGGGRRSRTREPITRFSRGGDQCQGNTIEEEVCETALCPGEIENTVGGARPREAKDSCCSLVTVSSNGAASLDQALYMGNYQRLPDNYNGRAAYRHSAGESLYIYYFTSVTDNLSLWVIGPALGQFIAGIRNSSPAQCVHQLDTQWKYASRAGVWEDNDPSLSVKCRGRDSTLDSTTQSSARVDCEWSQYGPWSQCSRSCNGGSQIRVRRVKVSARGGGKNCRGGNRERRSCNLLSCRSAERKINRDSTRKPFRVSTMKKIMTTTTTTTTTTKTTTTRFTTRSTTSITTTSTTRTTSNPNVFSQDRRVQCWVCGSLFSTDAPDCPRFNKKDPTQQKTCEVGEACLYYSWKKSNRETAVIRECFPTSILLGSIEEPVVPQASCSPVPVESDSIVACICTTDLCTGIGEDDINQAVGGKDPGSTSLTPPLSVSGAAAAAGGVRCHQCGSLFSDEGNPSCKYFDPGDPSQQGVCGPGEACLLYSWERRKGKLQYARECFSTSVLLGTVSNPLTPSSSCSIKDISETPTSARIQACLCTSSLCNSYISPGEKDQIDLKRLELESTGGGRQSSTQRQTVNTRRPTQTTTRRPTTVRTLPREEPRRPNNPGQQNRGESFHRDAPGLQCYSCGSLLNPNKKCDKFDRTDKSQVQTCLTNEACLMYTWRKSPTETATLRECFPTRVLLGSIDSPLTPVAGCQQRDITDDGSGSILACLCDEDFCNDDQPVALRDKPTQKTNRLPRPTALPSFPARQTVTPKCPKGFQVAGGQCYHVSTSRVGWVEARKMCELKEAILAGILTQRESSDLEKLVKGKLGRRRNDFWLSGNDIEKEGRWEWAATGGRTVPDWGWSEEPYNSPEENCLAWSISSSSSIQSSWHGSSCCNNLRYICKIP